MCGLTRQCASSAQSWFTPSDAHGHRDRAFDRLDDVGEADLASPAGRARSRRRRRAPISRPARGEPAHQFLRGRQRHAGLLGELGRADRRAPAVAAGGGGHHHDRIIGKVGQAHVQIGAIRIRFSALGAAKTQPFGRSAGQRYAGCMPLYPLVRPLAFALDAERAHRLTIAGAEAAAARPAAAQFPDSLPIDGRRPRLPDRRSGSPPASTRMPRSPTQMLGLRLRLRRGRDADAAAAGGQSASRGCSGSPRTRR